MKLTADERATLEHLRANPEAWQEGQCRLLCFDEAEAQEFYCERSPGHEPPHLALPSQAS